MDKALATQLANIEKRTGKTLDELTRLVKNSGLQKHGEVRDWLQKELKIGYGDANTLVHTVFKSSPAVADDVEDEAAATDRIYAGPRAALRAIHDAVMTAVRTFGPFEIAPKKTYLSLRRKKQFAMVGPATNTRVEVGLNMKGVPGTSRLEALPPGGMCQYRVKITAASEVDRELVAWIRQAYDAAGSA
jgi:Domain of unknown function (DUF5655)/Domain of unknown function (DUF4287)